MTSIAKSRERKEAARLYRSSKLSLQKIGERLGVSVSTLRKWKKLDGWDSATKAKTRCKKITEKRRRDSKSVRKMARILDNADELTEKEKLFCAAYVSCWNTAEAARLAGYEGSRDNLKKIGWEVQSKPHVKAYLDELRAIRRQQIFADGTDLLDLAQRVVFGSVTQVADFGTERVEIEGKDGTPHETLQNFLRLKSSASIDGQLLREINVTKSGVQIRMRDAKPYFDLLVRSCGLDQTESDKDALERLDRLIQGFNEEAAHEDDNEAAEGVAR